LARDIFKIDLVIHTEQMAAEEIKAALLVPGAVNVESLRQVRIDGPVLGQVKASESYEVVNTFGCVVLTTCMLLGHLESFTARALFSRHSGESKRKALPTYRVGAILPQSAGVKDQI